MKTIITHIVAALESSPTIDQEHVRLARKALNNEKPAKATAPAPDTAAKKTAAKKKSASASLPAAAATATK